MTSTADWLWDYRTSVLRTPHAQETEVRPSPSTHTTQVSTFREVFGLEWSPADAWAAYLDRLPDRQLAKSVVAFWREAKPLGPLPVPTAIPFEGSMHLAWDHGQHHLDVDLFPDGTFEWFYRNRSTNELDGTDESRATGMPEAFARRVRLVVQDERSADSK